MHRHARRRALVAELHMIEKRTFASLGAECEIFGIGVASAALGEGEAWVHRMHDRLTRFNPWSELSKFNDTAFTPLRPVPADFGRWVAVSADLEALLRESLRAFEVSSGLVHVGILPALRASGYTRDFDQGPTPPTAAPPAPAPLPELLEVRTGHARLRKGAALDLGGVAKGWMADRLAEHLGANVLVNLGGDLYARGGGGGGEGWPVGFGGKTVLLKDLGAATSGITKRHWAGAHHLIDPRTALPAKTDLREVSVLASSAADAEIYAKVAMLLGSADAPKWLEGRSAGWALS
jgi:thiamine biosynthesis lipoprotein